MGWGCRSSGLVAPFYREVIGDPVRVGHDRGYAIFEIAVKNAKLEDLLER